MSKWILLAGAVALTLALAWFALPMDSARANALCVNPSGTGGCYAQVQAAIDAASPGDTINIAAGTYYPFGITKDNLTLIGAGITQTRIIPGPDNSANGATISALTLFSLSNSGSLDVTNVAIQDNAIVNSVSNFGRLTITDAAISHSGYANKGGGTAMSNDGVAILTNVTFSDNPRGNIQNRADLTLQNVTLYGTGYFPALDNSGTVTMTNTILSRSNSFTTNCNNTGTLISLGYNLSSDNTCPLNAADDITNTNPLLAPLSYYGGSTLVHALFTNSPAIDAGTNTDCPLTDQRGFPRPYGSRCDIGAYEYQPPFWSFTFFPFVGR